MALQNSALHHPLFEGEPFYWHSGPVGVLLLHGYTSTTSEVRPLAQALHARGLTVMGPLLPGHGTTPEELNNCSWRDWVRAAEGAFRQISSRCERVFIAGESMGSLLTLYLASEHPEAAGVLVYAPAVRIRISWLDRRLLPLISPFRFAQAKADLGEDGLWQGYRVNPLRSTRQLLKLEREARSRLSRIRQPIFIAQGRLDKSIYPAGAQEVYDTVRSPFKELVWYERSGHTVIIDVEREAVAERSAQFIERALIVNGWAQNTERNAPSQVEDSSL